jgi:hypothetical protein
MRVSVIEMEKDGSIFYNLGVFKEHEDLIVFNARVSRFLCRN